MSARLRGLRFCTVLCAAALFVALALPALRGGVYTANDLGEFHLPLRSFYAECLTNGDAFDWCPDLYCGFYLTGEGQTGSYHPMHRFLYRCLPLSTAWNIECLVSYPFMFAGLVLLLRRWRFNLSTAWFGAIVFTFSSFNLLHFVHVNAVAVVAHLPWLLYCIEQLTSDRSTGTPQRAFPTDKQCRVRRLAWCGIAALTASQLLLGYPQYVLLSLIAEMSYLAVILIALKKSAAWRLVAIWSLAKALGVAIGAVQLLPTLDALSESVRAAVDADFASAGSLHPLNLLQLVAPYLLATRVVGQNTHELGLYVGAVPLLLAMIALTRGRVEKPDIAETPQREFPTETVHWFAIVLVVFGLLLSLGEHGPIHWLVSRLPIVSQMRFPCRAIVLIQFGVAILAAIGFAKLLTTNERTLGLPVWLCVVASFVVPGVAAGLWPTYLAGPSMIAIGPLLFCAAAALLYFAVNCRDNSALLNTNRQAARSLKCFSQRIAIYGLVALTAVDLGMYGLSYAVYRDVQPLDDFIATTSAPTGQPNGRVVLETLQTADKHRAGNRILLKGWQRADGYAGLEPAKQLDYQSPFTWVVAGVTWTAKNPANALPNIDTDLTRAIEQPSLFAVPQLQTGKTVMPSSRALPYLNDAKHNWLLAESPLPRARIVTQIRPAIDYQHELPKIEHTTTVLVEPSDQAVIDEHLRALNITRSVSEERASFPGLRVGLGRFLNDDAPNSQVELISDRPGGIQLRVECEQPAILVLTESFHSGWQAGCDGSAIQTVRVNGDFLGCLIQPGRHDVQLSFQPAGLRQGRLVSICGLGLLILMVAGSGFIRPRRTEIDL